MDLFIPHTPLAFVIIALFVAIVCVKVIRDMKAVRASRNTHNLIMKYMTKKNVPQITVMVELRKTADTLFPLLDHLSQHNYPGLEIVVVVKHTAGKYAQAKLMYYRRKHQFKGMKIVKHSKGMHTSVVIGRYISSPFVMSLQPTDRLSTHFFTSISLELLDKRIDAFVPRVHILAGKTLVSALGAVISTWRHMFTTLRRPRRTSSDLLAGSVYRSHSLLKSGELRTTYVPRVAVHRAPTVSWRILINEIVAKVSSLMRSGKVRIIIAAGIAVGTGLIIYVWDQNTLLLAELILILYVAVYGLLLVEVKGYSFFERLNLLVFAPFSMMFIILLSTYSFLRSVFRQIILKKT